MLRYLIFSFLFTIGFVNAQSDVAYAYVDNGLYANSVFNHQKNEMVKVYVDQTKIRELPTLTSKVVDSVSHNKSLKIIEVTGAVTQLGERAANWLRVAYDNKTGFIWSGNLAISQFSKHGVDILFGIPSTETKINPDNISYKGLVGGIKYFKNENLVSEKNFDAGTTENLSAHTLTVEKAIRLKNIDYTINTMVSGEACGIPTYEQTIFVTKDNLILLPKTESVADGGIFYHSESIELPSAENKLNNQFYYILEKGQTDDNEVTTGEKIKNLYQWDGQDYKNIKTIKEAIKS